MYKTTLTAIEPGIANQSGVKKAKLRFIEFTQPIHKNGTQTSKGRERGEMRLCMSVGVNASHARRFTAPQAGRNRKR